MGATIRRWGAFNLVGLAGFVLQLGAISTLTRTFGWPPAVATAAGLELACLLNFVTHNRWTWREYPPRGRRGWMRRWWRYQAAKTASLGANLAITAVCVSIGEFPIEVANTVAVAACALPNFLIADRLIFTEQ